MSKRRISTSSESSASGLIEDEDHVQICKKELVEINKKIDVILKNQKKLENANLKNANAIGRLAEEILSLKKEVKKTSNNGAAILAKCLPEQPFAVVEEFDVFEQQLRDEDFFQNAVRELASFGSKAPQEFVRKSWRRLIDDSVAQNYCWMGTKNKKAVKDLVTTAAIRAAFQLNFKMISTNLVEEIYKKNFQYSADRLRKRQEYTKDSKNKVNENNAQD